MKTFSEKVEKLLLTMGWRRFLLFAAKIVQIFDVPLLGMRVLLLAREFFYSVAMFGSCFAMQQPTKAKK